MHGSVPLVLTGVGTLGVAIVGAFQSVVAGFTIVHLLGGILTTLVLFLLVQVIALRNQASANAAKVHRAIADIAAAEAELKEVGGRLIVADGVATRTAADVDRLIEDVSAMTVRLTDVVSSAKRNDEELNRLREGRHDYEEKVSDIMDTVRTEVIRLGGFRPGGKR
jgi:hypothetical protein